MKILPITDPAFAKYGFTVAGHDFTELLHTLVQISDKPADSVIYVPADAALMQLPIAAALRDNLYGGMPVQIGYCNGSNHQLNCLEYHRGSEINIAADDVVLLLAPLQELRAGKLDTALVEAFLLPAGTAALLYETTLHYAPCNAPGKSGFRVIIILPAGTNTEKPQLAPTSFEDKLLWARNKWLIAHADSAEAKQGAFVGLCGENINLLCENNNKG